MGTSESCVFWLIYGRECRHSAPCQCREVFGCTEVEDGSEVLQSHIRPSIIEVGSIVGSQHVRIVRYSDVLK